ncbi:hypothetical protein F4823DRAFT_480525 [Ustulina deusta]|nr:hypothetical protein F4823DRAFT_480525 [Ustulina deusta]
MIKEEMRCIFIWPINGTIFRTYQSFQHHITRPKLLTSIYVFLVIFPFSCIITSSGLISRVSAFRSIRETYRGITLYTNTYLVSYRLFSLLAASRKKNNKK